MGFGLLEGLNIALALSFGVLRLCNTPWLGTVVTLGDIVSVRVPGASQCFTGGFDYPSPFRVHPLPTSASPEKKPRPVNFTLLLLGMLLTHMAMGHAIEAVELDEKLEHGQASTGLTQQDHLGEGDMR